MSPTIDSNCEITNDEPFVRAPDVPDPAADDPENWWLDLGRVEFPGLAVV